LTIELHTYRRGEEEVKESSGKAVGGAEGEIPTRSQYPPRVLNPYHVISKLSNAS
jgi:hypothetical protein